VDKDIDNSSTAQSNATSPAENQTISSAEACERCAEAHKKGKESAAVPDISHGPEMRTNALDDAVDVTTNGGRAKLLAKGEITLDACRRTTRQVLKLLNNGVLKKDDLGGNIAPICERQATGEFSRILLPGDFLNRGDERACEEICFKLDGRLTMAIQQGELLPRPTPIGMLAKGTPESFCDGFGESVYSKVQLTKIPVLPEGDVGIPTVPPTPPPDPLEVAGHWATGLGDFHPTCVDFLDKFEANVSDTVQLTSRQHEDGREGGIDIHEAFPWSKDFEGFQACQKDLSQAGEKKSEAIPAAFHDKDWPKQVCLDLALGYMSVRSAHLEAPQGLVAEAQALTVLSRASPDMFCRMYEAQFGQQAPPAPAPAPPAPSAFRKKEAGERRQDEKLERRGSDSASKKDGSPSESPGREGGLSGQMSGNEDPPRKPDLTRSTSANHAEQKQRGTEKKDHWMTGTMPGPNHDMKSIF